MKKPFYRLTLSLLLLMPALILASGCASVKVKTDFDSEYDFSTLQTYRWATGKELNPDDVLAKNPLVRKRFVKSVDNVMAWKRFTLLESGDADFVIVMHAGAKERIRVDQTPGAAGIGFYGRRYYRGWYDPWWGAYGNTTTVSHYTEGTLVIDIVPWKTKELAWRGMGTKTIGEYNSEKQQKCIDAVVTKILNDFPPR